MHAEHSTVELGVVTIHSGAFTRYSRDQSFAVLGQNAGFLSVMAIGSMVGTFIGGRLLGLVPTYVLLPLLAAVLVMSAVKVWRHQ
jgi:uncharacterized membrane protein YfcA